MRRATSVLLFALALSSVLATAAPASARLSQDYTYSFDQLWRASVRLIAVDFRFPITQRDEEIGFVLFDYQEGGRTYSGSLELVRTEGANGTPQVRVSLAVQNMPTYVERMMIDRLSRKLSGDYGQPPPSRRPEVESPSPAPDEDDAAGDDDDEGEDD